MTNAPAPEVSIAPKSHTCGKCDGKGTLSWTRVANGVCFWCHGTGRIAADSSLTDDKWYRIVSATDKTHTITQKQASWIIDRVIELGREAQQGQAAA